MQSAATNPEVSCRQDGKLQPRAETLPEQVLQQISANCWTVAQATKLSGVILRTSKGRLHRSTTTEANQNRSPFITGECLTKLTVQVGGIIKFLQARTTYAAAAIEKNTLKTDFVKTSRRTIEGKGIEVDCRFARTFPYHKVSGWSDWSLSKESQGWLNARIQGDEEIFRTRAPQIHDVFATKLRHTMPTKLLHFMSHMEFTSNGGHEFRENDAGIEILQTTANGQMINEVWFWKLEN